jgi:hypothetical protein
MRPHDLTGWLYRRMRQIPLSLSLAIILSFLGFGDACSTEPAINVRSAEVNDYGNGFVLDAMFQIDLGPTLQEALQRGLSLHFVADFELRYERWYLFGLWDKTISTFEQRYRLSYNALTQQYRLTGGSLTQNFETLPEALSIMARIQGRHVASRDDLDPGVVYLALLRLRLDSSQLPKPFQLSSIGSKNWNISSDWYRWTVRP